MLVTISSSKSGASWNQFTFPAILFGLVILAGLIAIIVCKKWLNSNMSKIDSGFTYHQLKEMQREGKINEQEYIAARDVLTDRTEKTANNHKLTTQILGKETSQD